MSYLISTLHYAVSRKRPHLAGKGNGQRQLLDFVKRTVSRKAGASNIRSMPCGNLLVDARGIKGGTSRTLFVAHCDTVHAEEGRNQFTVKDNGRTWAASGAPLGADDGAGVAMLVNLLMHGVPGFYVFTVGEECGGIGATAFAKLLAPGKEFDGCFDRAIAFDRRGIDSVITSQSCGMCASDEFADALAQSLMDCSKDALMYAADSSGVYTDTAEFVDFIPECTNISVGYDREHSQHESLNVAHLQTLAAAAISVDWEALPVKRTPGDSGYEYGSYGKWMTIIPTWSKQRDDDRSNARPGSVRLCDALDAAEMGMFGELRDFMMDAAHAWYDEDPEYADVLCRCIARFSPSAAQLEQLWDAAVSADFGGEVIDCVELFLEMVEDKINA